MFSLKSIASVLAVAALASAAPTNETELATPVVTVCTGSLVPRAGCADIVVTPFACVNFLGGFAFLNDEVSNAQIPGGLSCTFYANFGCLSTTDSDSTFLQGGLQGNIYSMFNVPGSNGNVNFNDQTSSYSCSV